MPPAMRAPLAGLGAGSSERTVPAGASGSEHPEGRALTRRRLHDDPAPRLRDAAMRRRQPQPRAAAGLLRREERLEDAVPQLRSDARAGVGDGDARERLARPPRRCYTPIRRRPPSGMASRAFSARFMTTCSSCARSATTGDRGPVGEDVELDVRAEQRLEHRRSPRTTAATSSVVRAPGRRRENARSCEVSSAARLAARRTSSTAWARVLPVDLVVQDRAVAADHGHEVVEVVRDASGQAAERLEPPCLVELIAQAPRLGDVVDRRRRWP